MTPHINAKTKDIAKLVLMVGDPLRAKYIAENFLKNFYLVNVIRNMYIYTGIYKEKKITIASSGIGAPSMGIYSYELYKFYNVDTIIRIGSAGSYMNNVKIYDIINVKYAYSESIYAKLFANINNNFFSSTKKIFNLINKTADELNLKIYKGNIHSSDIFYCINDSNTYFKQNKEKYNLLCVEMESFALFCIALQLKKNAACLLTISDSLITNEMITPEARQNNFQNMINLALHTIHKL